MKLKTICIIGGLGSIGSRYACILKYFKIPYVIKDIHTPDINLHDYDKFIIATPTPTHIELLNILQGKTILCEKPISKDPLIIPNVKNVYTVCNYNYIVQNLSLMPPFSIEYDYYRTGKDGILWDCCQLIYLDPEAKISTQSPKWNLTINGEMISYRELEESYILMLLDFAYNRYENLWTLEDGRKMTEAVLGRLSMSYSSGVA